MFIKSLISFVSWLVIKLISKNKDRFPKKKPRKLLKSIKLIILNAQPKKIFK